VALVAVGTAVAGVAELRSVGDGSNGGHGGGASVAGLSIMAASVLFEAARGAAAQTALAAPAAVASAPPPPAAQSSPLASPSGSPAEQRRERVVSPAPRPSPTPASWLPAADGLWDVAAVSALQGGFLVLGAAVTELPTLPPLPPDALPSIPPWAMVALGWVQAAPSRWAAAAAAVAAPLAAPDGWMGPVLGPALGRAAEGAASLLRSRPAVPGLACADVDAPGLVDLDPVLASAAEAAARAADLGAAAARCLAEAKTTIGEDTGLSLLASLLPAPMAASLATAGRGLATTGARLLARLSPPDAVAPPHPLALVAASPRFFLCFVLASAAVTFAAAVATRLAGSVTLKVWASARGALLVLLGWALWGETLSTAAVGGYGLALASFGVYVGCQVGRKGGG